MKCADALSIQFWDNSPTPWAGPPAYSLHFGWVIQKFPSENRKQQAFFQAPTKVGIITKKGQLCYDALDVHATETIRNSTSGERQDLGRCHTQHKS